MNLECLHSDAGVLKLRGTPRTALELNAIGRASLEGGAR